MKPTWIVIKPDFIEFTKRFIKVIQKRLKLFIGYIVRFNFFIILNNYLIRIYSLDMSFSLWHEGLCHRLSDLSCILIRFLELAVNFLSCEVSFIV